MGVMGSGLAKVIRAKYPLVYDSYLDTAARDELQLGYVLYVTVSPTLMVANLCGQKYYGGKGNYTDYDAVRQCLRNVQAASERTGKQIFIPHGMSCGLAGGDWNVVYKIIEEETPNAIIISKP
jgi:O-acetyl-ADP-ribose deacetylase (regulator of RNase III)